MEPAYALFRTTKPDFKSLFEATPSPYLVVTPDFTIVAVNNAYLEATQTSRDEIIGHGLFEVFPDNPRDPFPTGVANLRASLLRALLHKRPDTMAIQKYDIRIGGPKGSEFEERYWSAINTPVMDATGKVLHIIHRVEDVTAFAHGQMAGMRPGLMKLQMQDRQPEHADPALDHHAPGSIVEQRKLNEYAQSLIKSEAQYRSLFNAIDEGFCIIQMLFDQNEQPVDYRFCEINPTFEKQTGLYGAVGKTMRELAPTHETHWFDIYGNVAKTGEPIRFENEAKALNRWFDVYAFRIDEPDAHRVALLFKDITDKKRVENELRETAERLQFAVESAQLGTWEADLVKERMYRSLRHDQCFGYQEPIADWSQDIFMQHVHPDDRVWVKQEFETAIKNGKDWHFECRVIWPDGSTHWIAAHGSVHAVDGKPVRMAGIITDITERKQAEEKIRHASLHDALTGLPNRAMLFEYASHLLPRNRRTGQYAAVLFLDLDRFKPINDTHGHEAGDAVLKVVADRLATSLRAEDIVIRLGGDEFIILLQDIKYFPYAEEIARHVAETISEPFHIGELTLSLSASIGISIFPRDGYDIATLLCHADMAMYQAKHSGGNNAQFYCSEFSVRTKQHLTIEQQLKSALLEGAFHLCYQPVLDVATGEIVSVEALLRWKNSEIGPDRFVPIAEATGIINPIGCWLLEEALRQYKTWREHGLPAIPIAVNVSVVEFRDRDFVGRFVRTIRKHGIDMSALQLELTETAVMDDIEHAAKVLVQLRGYGVTVLLDGFGTGYSSLSDLARLPLNKLKINKSFIGRLESDLASRAITDAMIALGRTLNLEIVAEGIESIDALDYIGAHGCSQAQGFYIGKPMTGASFESWFYEHRKKLAAIDRAMGRHH